MNEFWPSTTRWIPLLTQTAAPAHRPLQKYSPASVSSTCRMSSPTVPFSRPPPLLIRLSASMWKSTDSPPNLFSLTVSRGSSWSERRWYQVTPLLDVRLQVREASCPAWTTRAERRTGEAEDRWTPATPEEEENLLCDVYSTIKKNTSITVRRQDDDTPHMSRTCLRNIMF